MADRVGAGMSPRIPIAADLSQRRLTRAEERARLLERNGPDIWLYFGTYPTDTFTSYYSPAFQNGFARAGSPYTGADGFPRVRWDEYGRLEFAGVVSMGTDNTVMVTLPEDWRPDVDDFWPLAVLNSGVPAMAVAKLVASTGNLTIDLV